MLEPLHVLGRDGRQHLGAKLRNQVNPQNDLLVQNAARLVLVRGGVTVQELNRTGRSDDAPVPKGNPRRSWYLPANIAHGSACRVLVLTG